MYEDLLAYIWKLQYFSHDNLATIDGLPILVNNSGLLNVNSGPDFLNARININNIEWHGAVEIHVKSSNWYKHNHHKNKVYDNVILHVVWEHDMEVFRSDGSVLPTLSLNNKVEHHIIDNYNMIIKNNNIMCSSFISSVPTLVINNMLDKCIVNRLANKSDKCLSVLKLSKYSWEDTVYKLLLSNFGFSINSSTFIELSNYIPINIVHKEWHDLSSLEALFLGQAGFLDNVSVDNDYVKSLIAKYSFLADKYSLNKVGKLKKDNWKFFRLRPANFPTIRISQFCKLLNMSTEKGLMGFLVSLTKEKAYNKLSLVQSNYWRNHYLFGKKSSTVIPGLGSDSIRNIIINTIVPIMVTYGKVKGEQKYIDQAINILETINPENNNILKQWNKVGIIAKNAYDSQALIELYNSFCYQKKCLNCSIGDFIIKYN